MREDTLEVLRMFPSMAKQARVSDDPRLSGWGLLHVALTRTAPDWLMKEILARIAGNSAARYRGGLPIRDQVKVLVRDGRAMTH